MQTKIINSLNKMNIWADSFIKDLPVSSNRAVVVGLSGDLGSGKTTFVQSVAKILKIEKYITSPTFVIQKRYKITNSKISFENLIHIDAYRLESGEELLNLDWKEIVKNPKNLVFIEWPEKVEDILDDKIRKIYFKFIGEGVREISYEK